MITVSVKGVLIGILLIALIVLVVFLIVLVSNATDTIKKANAILDGSTEAVKGARNKIDEVNTSIKEKTGTVTGYVKTSVDLVQGVMAKLIR